MQILIEECASLHKDSSWTFIKGNIADKNLIDEVFSKYRPAIVVNLAAQAGVRYSITNPDVYIESNLIGFYNILEACRAYPVEHLVYASSSSVYGSNKKVPYSVDDKVHLSQMAKKVNYSAAFKSKVAIEALREQSSIANLSQKYGISQMPITRWRQELLEHSSEIFSGTIPNEESHQKEVDRLDRKVDFCKRISEKFGIQIPENY